MSEILAEQHQHKWELNEEDVDEYQTTYRYKCIADDSCRRAYVRSYARVEDENGGFKLQFDWEFEVKSYKPFSSRVHIP
jgi:hypothetical protein